MPSRRQERVAKRIVQEAVAALRDLKHVRLGFITVTRCEVSPDLRHAKVFISVFGDDAERERTLNLVKGNASRLRGMIGRPLGLKMTPELHFAFDDTIATSDQINRLIKTARESDPHPEPLTGEEAAALVAASRPHRSAGRRRRDVDADPFEAVRFDVEEELLPDDDDPAWRPIRLDDLPEDDDDDEDDS
ncbi:MAG: 30S ribosome-binding factor RbfA [Planctomycetota bacterium]|jgi:ribosome-binding factor A|nr:30S ribosome-binding factor RbfA [Planctomycetota bacterium]